MKHLFFTLTILLFCSSTMAAPLKVGAILPLTGSYSRIGVAMHEGLQDVGDSSFPGFQIVVEDEASFDRQAIVTAYKKLVAVDNVDAVVITTLPVLKLIEPLRSTLERRPPVLVLWDYHEKFHDPANCIFMIGYSNSEAGADLARFSRKALSSTRLAVISAQDEWSEKVSAAFKETFEREGGRIVSHSEVSLEETNFRPLIMKLKASDADGVFFPLYLGSIVNFIRQARELRYDRLLITGEGLLPGEIEVLGDAARGIWFQRIPSSSHEDPFFGFRLLGNDAGKILERSVKFSNSELCARLKGVEIESEGGSIAAGEYPPRKEGLEITRVE